MAGGAVPFLFNPTQTLKDPEMNITLRPAGRGGRYAALLNGRVLVESRTPIFDAGRVLLSEGVSPDEPLIASHEGSSVISMTTTVGKAAVLTVIEKDSEGPRLAKYRPLSTETAVSLRSPSSQTPFPGRGDVPEGAALESPPCAFSDDYAPASV